MDSRPTILITGASGGIGRAVAVSCADRGCRVAVHYHSNRTAAEHTLAALPGAGHAVFGCDLTEPDAVAELAAAVWTSMQGIDVLINNAGVSHRGDFTELDYESWQERWRRVMDTNLTGAANLTFCVAKRMVDAGGGRVVNVSSRGAFRGEPQMPWYGASKAGMNAMGQSLAVALAPHNVLVYTVAPGFVDTPMAAGVLSGPMGTEIKAQSPFGRVARPAEVARAVTFLALDAPEFMTGCIVDVNGASYLRS